MIRMALAAVILVLAAVLLKTGYLLSQVGITAMLYLSILFILNFKISRLSMIVVSLLTIFEFGYNAYLSQVTFGYDDVHKFADATVSVKRVTDNIRKCRSKILSVATDFAYSRTVPSLVSIRSKYL